MSSREKRWEVRRLDQLEAIASPVREEIVARLSRLGRASIADVARSLGRPSQTLYPHFEKLCQVGLLRRCGERPTGRRPEALYETPGGGLFAVYQPGRPAEQRALGSYVSASMRRAERNLRAAFETDDATTRGARRDTFWSQRSAWVTRDELAEINRHLREVGRLLTRVKPKPGTSLQSVLLGLHPVATDEGLK